MTSAPVWLLQPTLGSEELVAPYRKEFLKRLDRDQRFRFLFVGWDRRHLDRVEDPGLREWRVLPGRGLGPYRRGVGGAVLRAAGRGDFGVWVASTLNWWPTHASFPVVKARRKPFVLFTEDWWWPDGPGSGLVRTYGRTILHRADALVVAGSCSERFVIDNGAEEERVFVAYNSTQDLGARPYNEDEVRELRMTLTGSEDAFVFLYLNRIVAYKGLDVLLRAFREVETSHPDAWLVVCGDGPEKEACVRLAQDLHNVRFIDSVTYERVHLLYRACDLYVHPCRFVNNARVKAEAWGFTVNEAMSVGRPVLATSAVAAAHDLIDASTGFVIEPDDVAELTDRMLYAIDHRESLTDMGARAAKRVSEFTAERQRDGFQKALVSVGASGD